MGCDNHMRDIKRIREYEREWRKLHGEPKFSDVRWPAAERRRVPAANAFPEGGRDGSLPLAVPS